jgi:hypothetical protein
MIPDTDRELLKLAVIVSGIFDDRVRVKDLKNMWIENATATDENGEPIFPNWGIYTLGGIWNPLIDDGDALRLAVKLQMSLALGPRRVQACTPVGSLRGEFFQEDISNADPYAATRRAIVRAAAEIGRSMK